ncbi:MAG: SUMF1/EgtB/PvdO family nonheme iron enzyme [Symploca sp. SIO1C2]|nr:SUMF1/EgtB/PvdO family nonheme iron enzyme [Symploca sp. SIO1C2]
MDKNWAIIIGINNYTHFQSPIYGKRDAQSMGDFFQQEADFERVFLFTEDSPPIPTNTTPIPTQPTFGNLRHFLRSACNSTSLSQFEKPLLEPGDNLWFFFVGHGLRYDGHEYLLLSDTNPSEITKTALSINYLTQRLRQFGADNVILLLDACRNQRNTAEEGIGKERQQGVVTMYSCSPSERAYEIESLQHGSFTYSLLEALRIQGEGNCATVERLEQYLHHRVPEISHQYQKPPQTPYAIAEPLVQSHLILFPQYATPKDLETLKMDAFRAEAEGHRQLATQLWMRVNVAAAGSDMDVIKAFQRIFQKSVVLPSSPELPVVAFDVVTVNPKGQEIKRSRGKAQYFTEDLGQGVSLEMVVIPPGNCQMGSPDTEKERYDAESPWHRVAVASFCMSKYPVTQAQWQAVAALPQINQELTPNPSQFKGADLPVEQVSWYDAVEFCARLSKETGKDYRLPSEAEWEYACRAGTITPFHFGKTITPGLANYNGMQTTAVGSFPVVNAFGLYDMHGNVFEWCADYWHENYKGAPTDGSVWLDDNDNDCRVLRGGSWYSYSKYCRSAYRYHRAPDCRYCHFGCRVVCPTVLS